MNKQRMSKIRILSLIMALLVAAGLVSSCGKNKESDTGAVYDVTNYAFSDSSNMYNYQFIHTGDKIVLYGNTWDDMSEGNVCHVFFFNTDGTVSASYDIKLPTGEAMSASLSEKGDFYLVRNTTSNPKDAASVEESSLQIYEVDAQDEAEVAEAADVEIVNMNAGIAEDEMSDSGSEDFEGEMAELDGETSEGEALSEDESSSSEDTIAEEPYEDTEGEGVSADVVEDAFEEEYQEEDDDTVYERYIEIIKLTEDGNMDCVRNAIQEGVNTDILNADSYVSEIIYDDGKVYLLSGGNILRYDETLNYEGCIESKKVPSEIKNGSFVRSGKGEIYCWYTDSAREVNVGKVNLLEGKIIESMKTMGEKYYINIVSGIGMDFTVKKGSLLYGFNFKDASYTKQVDFLNSDIMTDNVNTVAGLDDSSFMAIYRNMEDDSMCLGHFTKTKEKKNNNRKDITIAMLENNYDIKKAVAAFNKKNKEYRVRILDYNAMYGSDEWTADSTVIEKMNTDIIAGNMPDMLVGNVNLPINTYINKDLLEDLYPYIDNDPEMKREDFEEHIFEVFANDGKLYKLVPRYEVNTLMVKEKYVKGKTSWTVKEAQQILKESGALMFIPYMERSSALESCMLNSGSQFIDMEKGECHFDTEEFKDMLAFIKSFPSQVDFNDAVSNKLMDSYDVMYRNDLVLCSKATIGELKRYLQNLEGDFGEPVVNIGFPTQNGQGSSISTDLMISMSSLSEYKNGCWQFMRYFLTDEFQDADGWSFPIKSSVMDEKIRKAKEELYYEYEWGGKVTREPVVYYLNGVEIPIEPMTDEQEKYLRDFINSIENTNNTDKKVMDILKEECNEYFEGRATADETANRLQSRIKIYIYESQ